MKQLLILLCIILPLYSQDGREKKNGMALREILELNEEQVQKLGDLRKEHRTATKNLKRELRLLRMQLLEEFTDSEKVAILAKKTGEIHETLTIKMAAHLIKIKEVLTPKQLEQFKKLRSSNKKRKK